MAFLKSLIQRILAYWASQPNEMEYIPLDPVEAPKQPPVETLPAKPIDMPTNQLLPWDMEKPLSHNNWKNVRILCDDEGLSPAQKETLTATIWHESNFYVHAKCVNYAFKKDGTKYIASTDHGICQWNDYWHGKEISSQDAEYNPEKAVRLMCKYWKNGQQNQWVAYSSGAYKKYEGKKL